MFKKFVFIFLWVTSSFTYANQCDNLPGTWRGTIDPQKEKIETVTFAKYKNLIYLYLTELEDRDIVLPGTCIDNKINMPDFEMQGTINNNHVEIKGSLWHFSLDKIS